MNKEETMNDEEIIKQHWRSYCALLIVVFITGWLCLTYNLIKAQCLVILNMGPFLGYMAYMRYYVQHKEEIKHKTWFIKLKTFLYFLVKNTILPCMGYALGALYVSTDITKTIVHFLLIAFIVWIAWSGLLYGLILLINKITNYKITWYNINP